MSSFIQDLRHALRLLGANRGFTVVALTTLAIGIGANSAIFSVVNAVVLRPLPYPEPDRIVRIREERPQMLGARSAGFVTSDTLQAWRESSSTLEQIAGYGPRSFTLTGEGDPVRLRGASVSPDLFPLLRATPALGRLFRAEEERPGANDVVILSDGLWRRQFGADPQVLGRSIVLDDVPHRIVGVIPPTFSFPDRETVLYAPLTLTIPNQQPGRVMIMAFPGLARLRPGATIAQATVEGQTIVQRIHASRGGPAAQMPAPVLSLVPLQADLVADTRPALLVMMAAVGFVLLIAAANVANLLLARGVSREREIAIRLAVGADRGRLVRQLLTESMLLSLAGGALGLLAATWIVRLLPSIAPGDIPRIDQVGLDTPVLLFTFGLSIVVGVLFGLWPALRSSSIDVGSSLKESHPSTGPAALGSGRSLLAVAEIALAFVLLVGAGLMVRSFMRLVDVDPGYDPVGVLTTRIDLPPSRYTEERRLVMFDQIIDRLSDGPGVDSVGLVGFLPLTSGEARVLLGLRGRGESSDPASRPAARPQVASAGYFRAMGLRLVEGRWWTPTEDVNGAPVVLVNESFARAYFPDADAVGQQLDMGGGPQEVIGVVADVRHAGLDTEPAAEFYGSYRGALRRFSERGVSLAIRATGDPAALVPLVRQTVQSLDPDVPLDDVMTMEARLAGSVARPRFYALALGLFSVVAATLAALGIYGVLAYLVSQRRREIGIRVAVGASRGDVLALVVRHGFALVALGVIVGFAGAVALTRLMRGMLFGVTPTDAVTFVAVPILLAIVGLLACYIPALRATRVDPVSVLRAE